MRPFPAVLLVLAVCGGLVGAQARKTFDIYGIKVSAQQDGTFTVTNSRNGFTKTYRARSGS